MSAQRTSKSFPAYGYDKFQDPELRVARGKEYLYWLSIQICVSEIK